MSRHTVALRPAIALDPQDANRARRMRRRGASPAEIATQLSAPVEEVEKALVQMRTRRPETTRGTLNVTLDAHRLVLAERQGNEPLWRTMDRLLDELLRLRAMGPGPKRDRSRPPGPLPLFGPEA